MTVDHGKYLQTRNGEKKEKPDQEGRKRGEALNMKKRRENRTEEKRGEEEGERTDFLGQVVEKCDLVLGPGDISSTQLIDF